MKKNYIQPNVDATELIVSGQTLCASTQFGGETGDIGEPIIIGG